MSFLNFIVNIFFTIELPGSKTTVLEALHTEVHISHLNRSTLLEGVGATAPILLAICSKCSYCVVDTV